MKIELNRKFIITSCVFLFAVLAILLVSVISFEKNRTGIRRTFIFPSAENGKLVVEYRNLAKDSVQGDVQYYVSELLLGSSLERTKLLFTSGTKVLSCFERDGILYLNLSEKLLEMGNGVVDIRYGAELLEKNIKKNFPKIHSVQLFVNGKYAFES